MDDRARGACTGPFAPPTNLLIVRHEMQINKTIKMAAWHGPSWVARRGPPSLERQQAVFTEKYSGA